MTRCSPPLLPKRALTLVEVLVATFCLVVLLIPLWRIFSTGSKQAMVGMLQVNTTMEARRVLRKIHDDLVNVCFEIQEEGDIDLVFKNLIHETVSAEGNKRFSFLRSTSGSSSSRSTFINERNNEIILLSRVTYRLEPVKSGKTVMKQLIREETLHPKHPDFGKGNSTKILSERINEFDIRTVMLKSTNKKLIQPVWMVTLQLIDSLKNLDIDMKNPPPLGDRAKGIVLADFFDVVYPEIFQSHALRPKSLTHWYEAAEGPPP